MVDDFEFRVAVIVITLLAYLITWANIINRIYNSELMTLNEILLSTGAMSVVLLIMLPILFKMGRSVK